MVSFLRKILTGDQTETFLHEKIGESYHSQMGAVDETVKKYTIPCKIKELARERSTIRILDVCFGMGYNSAMAISVALQENPSCAIEVVGLEHDKEIIEKIQEVNPPIPFFRHYKKLTLPDLEFLEGNVSVKLLLGDARETVVQLSDESFDAIFFDPFSPLTTPEMWEVGVFEQMCRVLRKGGLLATYSTHPTARENMGKAGLFWDDGPIMGRRGPGTVAWKWVNNYR